MTLFNNNFLKQHQQKTDKYVRYHLVSTKLRAISVRQMMKTSHHALYAQLRTVLANALWVSLFKNRDLISFTIRIIKRVFIFCNL